MSPIRLTPLVLSLSLLAACGGGSDSPALSQGSTTSSNAAGTGAASGTQQQPQFAARLEEAPPENAFFGFDPWPDTARFVVSGSLLRNVELVSANDESVVYGRFTVAPEGDRATLDWRFYDFRWGSYRLKVIAWDAPAGQPGQRIEVMPARSYLVHLPLGCQAEGTCGGAAP